MKIIDLTKPIDLVLWLTCPISYNDLHTHHTEYHLGLLIYDSIGNTESFTLCKRFIHAISFQTFELIRTKNSSNQLVSCQKCIKRYLKLFNVEMDINIKNKTANIL